MIPKKLRLKNFLSYGEPMQELDFDRFHVACLVGSNGSGKSSLIEAIGWCVWGEGRAKTAELIHEGATEARTEFEFVANDAIYKIVRIAKKKKNHRAEEQLEFQVFSPETARFVSLTEPSLSKTEARILETLGIDYETFISSAFIVQGRANEFTQKSARDRKKILTQILRIDRYQKLSERAHDKAKEIGLSISRTQGNIEMLEADLAKEDDLQARLNELKAELPTLETAYHAEKAALAALEEKLQTLKQQAFEAGQLREQKIRTEKMLAEAESGLAEKEAEQNRLEKLITKRAEIEAREHAFEKVQQAISKIEALAKEAGLLEREKIQREAARKEAINQHENEVRFAKDAAERHAAELHEFQEKIAVLETRLKRVAEVEKEKSCVAKKRQAFEKLAEEKNQIYERISKLKAQIARADEETEDITNKGKTLKDINTAECPLCRSPLDEQHRQHILDEYRNAFRELQNLQAVCRKDLEQEEKSLRQIKAKEAERQKIDQAYLALERQLAAFEAEARQLDELKERIPDLEGKKQAASQKLAALLDAERIGKYLQHENARITETETKLRLLGYNAEQHEQLRLEFQALSGVPREVLELAHATANLVKTKTDIAALREKQAELTAHIAEIDSTLNVLQAKLSDGALLKDEHEASKRAFQEKEADFQKGLVETQSYERELERLKQKAAEKKSLEDSIAKESEAQDIYAFLKEAFGVNGIQSLLIENTVPELQQEANALLQKLTMNRMSIMIRTQKPLKTKDEMVESLEIDISDATGEVRDYNTFSGGEKYRVDLALRIALSKLLAAQSGVNVKMLIIDEGFGTQDEDGLEAIIDSIDKISDEFEKIILITHLEKLRDAFEMKITVEKEPARGSFFSVATES
ncbi:SMC domain protein [Chloroherpeton thalassium ATCC 35110]|uniref:SMC domain protein n=1 Tax=Chloroherpeton thalassium (strain ATCC 35110 / GB-78) TaxID=517418 RepID=B3QT75_CHLT3|nr:SMC family ATPase [Chloroherpeton thalassium]ACF14174.1 SMC domain protein [Chloroherpeton thalassium ATCC 35110]